MARSGSRRGCKSSRCRRAAGQVACSLGSACASRTASCTTFGRCCAGAADHCRHRVRLERAPSGGAITPDVVGCNFVERQPPRSTSAYTAPRAEPRVTPRRRTTDRGRTVRVLQIRPALRDRAPSVCGIRHVLSQRASDALAPRTPSADDRAVHGTAGLGVEPVLFRLIAALLSPSTARAKAAGRKPK